MDTTMASSSPRSMEKLTAHEPVCSGATMTKKHDRTTIEPSMGLMAGADGLIMLARMAFAPPRVQTSARAAMSNVADIRLSQARTPTGPNRASTALCASSEGRLRSSTVKEPIMMSGKTMNSPLRMERKAGRPLRSSSRHKSE